MRKAVLILGHNYATQFIDIYNQYTRLFDPDKFSVTVAYLTGAPDEAIKQRTHAEQVLFLDLPKNSIRYLKIKPIQQLLKLCRENQFQIVICHRYKPSYIMLWVSKFHRIPAMIFVMHELGTMNSFGRQCLTALLNRKNMLFAGVSNAVRDDMRKHLWGVPKNRIVTLYNMIDVEFTEPQLLSRDEARRQLQLSDDSFVFATIARLVPNKDHKNLIRAFSLAKKVCPSIKLLLIGDGHLEAKLKAQVKSSHLENDILFTGFLPYGFRYMRGFDCFVLSSTQEAFGRVLLEAMIAKLPMIATRAHGIPEVVGDVGKIVSPKDPVAFAEAMKEVYFSSQALRDISGEKAYQRALQHFSIPNFHQQFWNLPLVKAFA